MNKHDNENVSKKEKVLDPTKGKNDCLEIGVEKRGGLQGWWKQREDR